MKSKLIFTLLIINISWLNQCYSQSKTMNKNENLNLNGPYLGQKPPGLTPQLFAPEIFKEVSGNSVHSSPSFSYDGSEMYYTVMPTEGPFTIKYMKMTEGKWSKPAIVPFTGKTGGGNSLFANNNDIILFKSKSPRYSKHRVSTLWQVKRVHGIWKDPSELDPLFDGLAMGTSITNSGTIYFTLALDGFGSHDIYKSQLINGEYSKPEKLGPAINSSGDDWQPFIAPDESYLVFGRYEGKLKQGTLNLYISFKNSESKWTEAINMGKSINEKDAGWPYVSPDGKYFFFVSSKDNDNWFFKVYWVDAKIIENLKTDALKLN